MLKEFLLEKEERTTLLKMEEKQIYRFGDFYFMRIENKIYQCFNTFSRKKTNILELKEEMLEKEVERVTYNTYDFHRIANDGKLGHLNILEIDKSIDSYLFSIDEKEEYKTKIRLLEAYNLNKTKDKKYEVWESRRKNRKLLTEEIRCACGKIIEGYMVVIPDEKFAKVELKHIGDSIYNVKLKIFNDEFELVGLNYFGSSFFSGEELFGILELAKSGDEIEFNVDNTPKDMHDGELEDFKVEGIISADKCLKYKVLKYRKGSFRLPN